MGQHAIRLTRDLERELLSRPQVTKIVRGKPSWYRGRKIIKVQNGSSGHVRIDVCVPEGQQALHVYTNDCQAVMEFVRTFAQRKDAAIRS